MIYRLIAATIAVLAPVAAFSQSTPFNNNIQNSSANNTNGTILNTSQQINNFPALQYQYGPGFSCQSATISATPYYIGSTGPFNNGNASGYGGMLSFTVPLDNRGVNECIRLAKTRADKEKFDLEIVRALRCLDFIKAGGVLTTPETQVLCQGVGFNKVADATGGALMPVPKQAPALVITQ